MKYKILTLLFLTCLMQLSSCGQAQTNAIDKQVVQMLNEFYSNYIAQIVNGPAGIHGERKIDSLRKQYCTEAFFKKIPEIIEKTDGDPFIKGQDCNANCLKTLSITKDSQKENLYIVTYLDSYNNSTITINVIVKKEKENYKIDSVF